MLYYIFQAGSPFHEPLFKFLIKFPKETVELFLTDAYLNDHHFTRVFLSEIKDKEHGEKFREILAKQTQKISDLLQSPTAAVVRRYRIFREKNPTFIERVMILPF